MTLKTKIFLSYSHADEDLKNEMVSHLSGIIRREEAEIWHDRKIEAGVLLQEEIQEAAYKADIFLFLVSSDFLKSEYCMTQEYRIACERYDRRECAILPVILRKCDWKVHGLDRFNVKPKDAAHVTSDAHGTDGKHKRDEAFTDVVEGVSEAIARVRSRSEALKPAKEYIEEKYVNNSFVNSSVESISDNDLFVDPDIYAEVTKESIPKFEDFCEGFVKSSVTILVGDDQSGKTTVAKRLQDYLFALGEQSVILTGKDMTNANIDALVQKKALLQFENSLARQEISVILDNFDECKLPDQIKEKIVRQLTLFYKRTLLTTFSGAPAVLYAAQDLPDPAVFTIGALSDSKVYKLVENWHALSCDRDADGFQAKCLDSYEQISSIFEETHLDKYPAIVLYYLQIMDTYSGRDLYLSSFAACYDTVIGQKLILAGAGHTEIDESKNFLSVLAYLSYLSGSNGVITDEEFESTLVQFEERFFSSREALKRHALSTFINIKDGQYCFKEDYIWYFLVARHIGTTLISEDYEKYKYEIDTLALEIFSKKSANIIIYVAYFTGDDHIISSILEIMDSLFDKADKWQLSDDSRGLILGLFPAEQLDLQAQSDIDENRAKFLDEKSSNLLEESEKVVAKYALPFLNNRIGDADYVADFSAEKFDADSYLKSVNALMRTHSIVGQILGARTGTYPAPQVMDCISRMVQASGRFTSLNHAIATVMLNDTAYSENEVGSAFNVEGAEAKRMFKKTLRIFGFWSVYLSQAGLARYLRQGHNVRALKRLVEENEAKDSTFTNPTPFNFSSVYLIAKFYSTEDFDMEEIEAFRKRYGNDSSIWALMRAVINLYSYYLPLKIDKKQWLARTFKMNLKRLEVQQYKAPKRLKIVKKDR